MRNLIFIILFICTACFAQGQHDTAVENYIRNYARVAVEEQIRTGIPAAIKLAQAIHESGAGRGELALKSNNHFGIKCKTNWTGLTAFHDDDEKGECFRAYDSVVQSYRDHSDFLKAGQRYAFLFSLEPTDYKGWANGLKKAGYATNPKYPLLIIKLIENYELGIYTTEAITGSEAGGQGIIKTGLNTLGHSPSLL